MLLVPFFGMTSQWLCWVRRINQKLSPTGYLRPTAIYLLPFFQHESIFDILHFFWGLELSIFVIFSSSFHFFVGAIWVECLTGLVSSPLR